MATLIELVRYLDEYLRIGEIPDSANALNGLEVENASGKISRVVAAVDACQASIDHAASLGTDTLLLVHHGLFWDGNLPVTGRRYRRLKALLDGGVALYAAHIPLDVHPECGNNVVLARGLGIPVESWWGEHRGVAIGVAGSLAENREALRARVESLLDAPARLIPGGPERSSRVGVITGAGGSAIGEARAEGIDTFITGEGAHHTFFDATEFGVNVIYAGHYATETVGVRALAEHLSARFGLPWEFHRYDTGM